MIVAQFNKSELAAVKKALTSKPHKRALRKAGNYAARKMRTNASRRIRQLKKLRARTVKKNIVLDRPSGAKSLADIRWSLHFKGDRIPLIEYKPRPTRKGITVTINRGKRTRIRSAFITTMRSGHEGVFRRVGQARLPIRELMASRPVDAMLKPGEAADVLRHGQEQFVAEFGRLLPLELDKASK